MIVFIIAVVLVIVLIGILIACYVNADTSLKISFDTFTFCTAANMRRVSDESGEAHLSIDLKNCMYYVLGQIYDVANLGKRSRIINSYELVTNVKIVSSEYTLITLIKASLQNNYGYEVHDLPDGTGIKVIW